MASVVTRILLALACLLGGADARSLEAQELRPPVAPIYDPQVQGASHTPPAFQPQTLPQAVQPAAPNAPPLGPIPLGQRPASKSGSAATNSSKITSPRTARDASSTSWSTMLLSLLTVLGLFLGTIWVIKRTLPTPAPRLPSEVVEVLGCAPLAGRQSAHLVRLGNKLLLVSVFPSGAETLTEITDPLEVDRIAGLCKAQQSQSTTASFRALLDQFGRETPAARRREEQADV